MKDKVGARRMMENVNSARFLFLWAAFVKPMVLFTSFEALIGLYR
jgi:hypothetical protein